MAKDKKKTLGIKTTRYFTKTCSNCNLEYPNWFTNCPKCGVAWDEIEPEETGELKKKTIKIVVKITEEDFDNKLEQVKLIFSADHGKSWFQMKMENKLDYFIAEIAEVPIGSLIIYYIEVTLINGEKVVENNEGAYYFYNVGMAFEKIEKKTGVFMEERETQDSSKRHLFKSNSSILHETTPKSGMNLDRELEKNVFKNSFIQPPIEPIDYEIQESFTIFGKPQTQIDPDLRICPHCNSKIKKMWSTCPICGKSV